MKGVCLDAQTGNSLLFKFLQVASGGFFESGKKKEKKTRMCDFTPTTNVTQ